MRRLKHAKNMKRLYRLTCQVLTACAIASTALLGNGGTAFAATIEKSNNTVTRNSNSDDGIFGGYVEIPAGTSVDMAITNNNTVNITAGAYTTEIAGGRINVDSDAAANLSVATGNTVNITDGIFNGAISGAFVHGSHGNAQADNNIVRITGGTFNNQSNTDICGGYALGVGGGAVQANGNTVEIENIVINVRKNTEGDALYMTRSIYGGYATSEGASSATMANNNSVTISGDTTITLLHEGVEHYSSSKIYGGYATNGTNNTANNNTLKIIGGKILCYDSGEGNVETDIGGGFAAKGTANGNKVILTGGTFGKDEYKINVYGGNAGVEAKENEVLIDGATIYGKVAGGYIWVENNSIVEGNKVTIVAGNIIGDVTGGLSSNGSAKGNKVIVAGGTIDGYVTGGSGGAKFGVVEDNQVIITGGTIEGCVIGGDSNNNSTNQNNTVEITGGTVSGDVIGGAVTCFEGNNNPIFNNNTVILGAANGEGTATITGDVYVNRRIIIGETDDIISAQPGGNLNVYNTGNSVGGDVYASGANVNFYVKDGDFNSSNPMLNVAGKADLSNAKVVARVKNLSAVIDSSINLVKANSILNTGTTYTITDGILANSSLELDPVAGTLKGKIDASKTSATEDAKSPAETQIVGVALVNTALDNIAGVGFSEAAKAAKDGGESGGEMQPFVTIGGSDMRQKSGSYVDVNSWNASLGFAKEVKNRSGKLLFGPVFNYGRGKYDSYLDNGTHGSGDSKVYALGGMVKQDNNSGVYYEGSLMLGHMKNDYSSNIISGMSYDNSANFYAMHLGVGKVQKLNKAASIDYYGKLFYSHQNSSTAKLSTGHIYDFDAIDSLRIRLGVRYTQKVNASGEFYAGLAWQHEFDSKVNATIRAGAFNVDVPSPGVKGESGILELGWKEKTLKGKLETGVGLVGVIGKQKGIGINAQLQWKF